MNDEAAERLRWAREQAGFETAADAARSLGMNEQTYHGHENGSRGFKREAAKYARRYKVTLDWLLDGRGDPRPGYNETEAALVDAFRRLPATEAHAYLQLLLARVREPGL